MAYEIHSIFWPNGSIAKETTYEDGKKRLIKRWYKDESKHMVVRYKNEKPHGLITVWNEHRYSRISMHSYYMIYGEYATEEEYREHTLVEKLAGIQ